jgi:hypothetical protein
VGHIIHEGSYTLILNSQDYCGLDLTYLGSNIQICNLEQIEGLIFIRPANKKLSNMVASKPGLDILAFNFKSWSPLVHQSHADFKVVQQSWIHSIHSLNTIRSVGGIQQRLCKSHEVWDCKLFTSQRLRNWYELLSCWFFFSEESKLIGHF